MSKKDNSSAQIVSDSIEIFENVNSKISELIDCSVKDFEILNKNFKNYYSSLETISEASISFINFLIELKDDQEFNQLKTQSELSALKLNENISNFLSSLKKLDEKLNYYLLILNNLNQDLSTIRLLFTNLKFEPLIETDNSIANKTINDIAKCLSLFESKILELRQVLHNTIKFTDEGFINALDLFTEQFESIKDSYNHISNLNKAANKHLTTLNKLEEKRKTSTSEIITNLQFQDILRQKIEHVQEAHYEITEDLRKAHKKNNALEPEELFKIRDITTLQSAQLIHSNQEYQSAVETILNKINELNTFLNKYQSTWNHFCKPERSKLQSIKSRLSEQLALLNTQCFSLTNIVEKFDSNLEILTVQINDLYNYLEEGELKLCSFTELLELFNKLEEKYSGKEKFNAIKQLKSELNKFETEFGKLNKKLKKFNQEFTQEKLRPIEGYKNEVRIIKVFSDKNSQYFTNHLSEKINELFNTPVKIEPANSFNIKEVSYYNVFEKEISKIISLLDNLLLKINVNKTDIDLETLEHLRINYTMDSERKVHDLITQHKRKKPEEQTEEDENDVEFF